MTENYFVFLEQPLCINIGKLAVGTIMRNAAVFDTFTAYDGEKVGPGAHEFHGLLLLVRVQ